MSTAIFYSPHDQEKEKSCGPKNRKYTLWTRWVAFLPSGHRAHRRTGRLRPQGPWKNPLPKAYGRLKAKELLGRDMVFPMVLGV